MPTAKNTPLRLFWEVNELLVLFCLWSSVSSSFICAVVRKAGGEELGGGEDQADQGLSRDDGLCVLGGPLTLQQHFSLSDVDELHVVFPLTPQGTTSCFSTSGSSRRDCLRFLKAAQSLLLLADQALAPDLTFTTKPHLRSHFPFPGF